MMDIPDLYDGKLVGFLSPSSLGIGSLREGRAFLDSRLRGNDEPYGKDEPYRMINLTGRTNIMRGYVRGK